jgi:hypothetical protein
VQTLCHHFSAEKYRRILVVSQVEAVGKKSMDFFVWQGWSWGFVVHAPRQRNGIDMQSRYAPCKGKEAA